MKVLDLYAGLGGWSAAFKQRGHDVITLDNDPAFGCTITQDIMQPVRLPWQPDIILASPPCEKFSTLGFQHGWFVKLGKDKPEPATKEAVEAMALVTRAVDIIKALEPKWWVIENPRAMLRVLDLVPGDPTTVWYCHLADHSLRGRVTAKPTDLWGNWPRPLALPEPCHNQRKHHSDGCCCRDHVAAPRGSITGTQGPASAAERAKVPYALSELMCLAAERDLRGFFK